MKYPKTAIYLGIGILLGACQSSPIISTIAANTDADGCLSTAGFRYSALQQKCVQPFNAATFHFADNDDDTLSVYVILSDDKQLAEVFANNLARPLILQANKGGYASDDGKIRLIYAQNRWRLTGR